MLLVPSEHRGDFPAVIDSTIRAAYVNCPTSWYWSFVRKLGSPGGSVDLIAGGSFAKGLEVVRREVWDKGTSFPKALSYGMAAAIAEWGDFVCPDRKPEKNIDRVVQALDFYFQRWPIESDPIRPYYWSEGQSAVEFTFAIPLPIRHPQTGDPLVYAGRNDFLGLYNQQLFIVDEKTAGQLGPTWGKKWNLRGQFTGYVWAAKMTNLPVAGAIVRGIAFYKNKETPYGAAESIQFRPQWMLEKWYQQLLRDVEAMIHAWKTGVYSQNFSDVCESYSGCTFCRLCESEDPEVWTAAYGHRDWNPLSRYPSGKPQEPESEVVSLGFTLGV